ncbi:MAG: hypothetical protein ACREFJ_12395 [Acetobacteraceae bacterium]
MHATVVSRPTADRAVMDVGTKSLTSDRVARGKTRSIGPTGFTRAADRRDRPRPGPPEEDRWRG